MRAVGVQPMIDGGLEESSAAGPYALIGPSEAGEAGGCCFAWGRIFVIVPAEEIWSEPLAAALDAYQSSIDEPVMVVVLVRETARRPGEELQARHAAYLERFEGRLAGCAFVVHCAGFVASFFISILSRVMMGTRRPSVPQGMQTNLETAAAWISRNLPDNAPTPGAIEDMLRDVERSC